MHDFDAALQKGNLWVKEMATELRTSDEHQAYKALRAGLHALRDRLGIDEAVQLGAQLPLIVRGLYFEGWQPAGKPIRARSTDDFLDLIEQRAPSGLNAEPVSVARATFRVLTRHLSPGETDAVRHVLPAAIAELWAFSAGP